MLINDESNNWIGKNMASRYCIFYKKILIVFSGIHLVMQQFNEFMMPSNQEIDFVLRFITYYNTFFSWAYDHQT